MHGQKFSVVGLKKAYTKVINFKYCASGTYVPIYTIPSIYEKEDRNQQLLGSKPHIIKNFVMVITYVCKQLHMRLSIDVYHLKTRHCVNTVHM